MPSEQTSTSDDKQEDEDVTLPNGFIELLKQLLEYLLKLFGKEVK